MSQIFCRSLAYVIRNFFTNHNKRLFPDGKKNRFAYEDVKHLKNALFNEVKRCLNDRKL